MREEALFEERYQLSIQRIEQIVEEETVEETYRSFFKETALFILEIDKIEHTFLEGNRSLWTIEELQEENEKLFHEILPENYEHSYANPAYAKEKLGEYGQILSFLYTEIRAEIPYVFERKKQYLAICNELFIEIYNLFEGEVPEITVLKEVIYWYASDYCDVFLADRIEEQICPERSFAVDKIMCADLSDYRYLYGFGEYITENELRTAKHLQELPEETIQKMADVYTNGYCEGFVITGKDLSKKKTVNITYTLGFEGVIKQAIVNFEKMGLKATIYRAAVSVLTKRQHSRTGYYGAIPNNQYEYDHRMDQGIFLDKKYIQRKLEVAKTTYEKHKELAGVFAGPALMEIFGEAPFSPEQKESVVRYTKKQEAMILEYERQMSQLTNTYIDPKERSFTVVAYPTPEIGEAYEEIFDAVIEINTLDAKLYRKIQQALIDELDKGEYVRIIGKGENETDIKIQLHKLQNPEKETLFENCVADVNIPVGEVFTSPRLTGTDGRIYVSQVYLNGLKYEGLCIEFKDGKVTEYTCTNFEDKEKGKHYFMENVLHNHETLPIGEFAIGTNTTAYVMAKKYKIEDKLPILIAEKTGPHFALGDTCYSWCEDIAVYNLDGKEIVARDNEVSILRKSDASKAYFQCHTDITIPYEEIEEISVVDKNGNKVDLMKDGKFVLKGTEELNAVFLNECL